MNARTKMWPERIEIEQSTRQPTETWGIEEVFCTNAWILGKQGEITVGMALE